jgi:hypothetical protein
MRLSTASDTSAAFAFAKELRRYDASRWSMFISESSTVGARLNGVADAVTPFASMLPPLC